MVNIAILASGNGSNAENIARYFNHPESPARVSLVVTNRNKAGVIERMDRLGIKTIYVPNSIWDGAPGQVVDVLRAHDIKLVVMAGFMHYVAPEIVAAYPHAILNIHPSLLPAYGGKGMYGHHVHQAVVAAGEKESGVTVHYVDEEMDHGDILMQQGLELAPGETPESLESKIHEIEYSLYPKAIEKAVERLDGENRPRTTPPPVPVEELWAKRMKMKFDPEALKQPQPAPEPASETPAVKTVPTAETATAPQPAPFTIPSEPQPPTYLVGAVLITILCCLPFGIAAIIFSSSVNSKYLRGDLDGAKKASERAKWCIIAGFSIGLVWQSLMIPITLLGG